MALVVLLTCSVLLALAGGVGPFLAAFVFLGARTGVALVSSFLA